MSSVCTTRLNQERSLRLRGVNGGCDYIRDSKPFLTVSPRSGTRGQRQATRLAREAGGGQLRRLAFISAARFAGSESRLAQYPGFRFATPGPKLRRSLCGLIPRVVSLLRVPDLITPRPGVRVFRCLRSGVLTWQDCSGGWVVNAGDCSRDKSDRLRDGVRSRPFSLRRSDEPMLTVSLEALCQPACRRCRGASEWACLLAGHQWYWSLNSDLRPLCGA